MAYMRSVWHSRDDKIIIIKKYYACRAMPTKKEVRETRAKRVKQTSAAQQEINQQQQAEHLAMLLLDNFINGDLYLTLTYSGKCPDLERVKKDFKNFKDKMRRIYRRYGIDMKYIGVIEGIGGRKRPHAHIVLPALPYEASARIRDAWPHGNMKKEFYGRYDDGGPIDAHQTMSYFAKGKIKSKGKEKDSAEEKAEDMRGRLQTSHNLIRRPPKKTRVARSEAYRTDVKPPKGYRTVEAYTYRGYTADGYPIQHLVYERCG